MKPEELSEGDSVITAVSDNGQGHKVICDKVRRWRGKYVSLMVLENQSYVDYRMVLRAMRLELTGYEKQSREAYAGARRKGVRLTSDEFLSRMQKGERLTPVLTLVLYLGRDKAWDGARSLYELLEIEEELKPFISDHKLNLYDYHEHSDFSVFKTENRALFEVLSCSGDKERMAQVLKQNPKEYSQLDRESIKAILGLIGETIELDKIKETNEREEEVYNMCKAFEDNRLEGIRIGEERGQQKGEKLARTEALKNLMESLNISLEEAMKLLKIPLEDKRQFKVLK